MCGHFKDDKWSFKYDRRVDEDEGLVTAGASKLCRFTYLFVTHSILKQSHHVCTNVPYHSELQWTRMIRKMDFRISSGKLSYHTT